jgi:secreted PhoX family phosphatase
MRMRWVENVARMGEMRNAYKIFVGNLEDKTPFGISRHRWEDNITIDLRGRVWIHLDQNRDRWRALVNIVMNLLVPQKAGNFSFRSNVGLRPRILKLQQTNKKRKQGRKDGRRKRERKIFGPSYVPYVQKMNLKRRRNK